MSSGRLPPTIDLIFGPSPTLALILATGHLLAITAALLCGLAVWLKIVIAMLLAMNALWLICTRALVMGPKAISRFVWQSDGDCEWQTRDGRFHHSELVPGMLIVPTLVVVRLRCGRWRCRTFCMTRDAVNREVFRRLRMRLNLSPPLAGPSLWKRLLSRAVARRKSGSSGERA